jgi:hypothetical protein
VIPVANGVSQYRSTSAPVRLRAARKAGTPLEVQQKLLRHADIRTTTLYGGVPMENKRAANSAAVREILIRKSSQ